MRATRMKSAALAAAVIAGLAVSTAPAEAAQCRAGGGALYICEYGVTDYQMQYPTGPKEQFLIGMDQAVWTRWTINGTWTGWQSLGGIAKSRAVVEQEYQDHGYNHRTWLRVKGADGATWLRIRGPIADPTWTEWTKV